MQTCKTCRYYDSGSQVVGGERAPGCHANPPQVVLVPMQDANGATNLSVQAFFPPTTPAGYCGGWEAIPSPIVS